MTDVAGRWRIVEMELWDRDDLDLVGPVFIEFTEGMYHYPHRKCYVHAR
jgi:hypothetical protein